MKRIVVAIPHAYSWLFTQLCISCLRRFPPVASGYECKIVIIDNSPWCPAIKGITETRLGKNIQVIDNPKGNKFHASALDHVVQTMDFDYLMTMETDVCVLRLGWLPWFIEQLEQHPHWYAAGHWHHEQFISPNCTLYRGSVLRDMDAWCHKNLSLDLRWGARFEKSIKEEVRPFPGYRTEEELLEWNQGPFTEKRGWPEGTVLREKPHWQEKGPSCYEPGQALYHWARDKGDLGYCRVPTQTAWKEPSWPYQTVYGDHHELPDRELELKELFDSNFYASHFWLGTGALTIIKHAIDGLIHEEYMRYGLPREARFWLQGVDPDVRRDTIPLIKKYGWHTADPLGGPVTERDREAGRIVEAEYAKGGVVI